jgi:cytochrome c-type biogenesis protein CcmH
MRGPGYFVVVLAAVALTAGVVAGQSEPDPARKIEGKLMAPCCWSSPVSQHQSEAATRIKAGIREQLAAGKTEQQILDFYVAEYGERILASPRPSGFNLLAWVLPALFPIAGAAVIWLFVRRSLSSRAAASLAEETPPVVDSTIQARIEAEVRNLDA